jgi:hypothetical protein
VRFQSSTTALVFSVVRDCTSIAVGACNAFEFVVISFAQRGFSRSVQYLIQDVAGHFQPPSEAFQTLSPSSSRTRLVNGYPRTCFSDRFGT